MPPPLAVIPKQESDEEGQEEVATKEPDTVLVRGFPPSWTEQDMKLIFALYGGVRSVTFVGDGAREAHVCLKQASQTERVVHKLNNIEVGDGELVETCTITCEALDPRKGNRSERSGSDSDSESQDAARRREQKKMRKDFKAWKKAMKSSFMPGMAGGFPMWPQGGHMMQYPPMWPGAMGGHHPGYPGGHAQMPPQMWHPGAGAYDGGSRRSALRSRSRKRL